MSTFSYPDIAELLLSVFLGGYTDGRWEQEVGRQSSAGQGCGGDYFWQKQKVYTKSYRAGLQALLQAAVVGSNKGKGEER